MKKKKRPQTKAPIVRESGCVLRKRVTPQEAEAIARKARPRRCCHDCVFCISAGMIWMQTLMSGFPVSGLCANHPDTPGLVRPIPHKPCRNFKGKPFRAAPPDPPNDKIRYIPLTRGLHAIVDAEDYEWLSKYKWYASPSPRPGAFYARYTRGKFRMKLMHRVIMPPPKGKVVDHINGNGLDNRRCNLRFCTQAQNSRNSRKHSGAKSRFIGIHPHRDKWDVVVTHNRKQHYGGSFDDEVEAAKARDRLALELHGEYARLNFPPENPPDEKS
ncbi:MAG: HNH endonuclease [Sedimentisphaerales bacterium]|nr:HNH endonuclease [Sedimentisphaerales bacterium]